MTTPDAIEVRRCEPAVVTSGDGGGGQSNHVLLWQQAGQASLQWCLTARRLRTKNVRAEIQRNVARCESNYEEAALTSVIGVFTSIDRALKSQDRTDCEHVGSGEKYLSKRLAYWSAEGS